MNPHNALSIRESAQHIVECETIARGSYDGFVRTALVAMLSARKPFHIVGDVVDDVLANPRGSRWLSATQRKGVEWLQSDKGRGLYGILANDVAVRSVPRFAMAYATQCPGLGLAKGGFLCQLMGIDIGCLDTHNVDKYALARTRVRLDKGASAQRRARQISAYATLCSDLGGSVVLWRAWCEYLATLYPETYANGFAVSELHVTYCKGG